MEGEIYVWDGDPRIAYLFVTLYHEWFFILFDTVNTLNTVAVEEENEMDGSDLLGNQFDKLGTLQKHLIRHRELFLSRQVETYKIDMVRSV